MKPVRDMSDGTHLKKFYVVNLVSDTVVCLLMLRNSE